MASKNISITEEVYGELARRKLKNESFSQELRRLMGEKKGKLIDSLGAWNEILTDKEVEKMEKTIEKVRKSSTSKSILKKLGL